MNKKNSYLDKTNFSKIALKNLNYSKLSKRNSMNLGYNSMINEKYRISEDQKFLYPYDESIKMFKSTDKMNNTRLKNKRYSNVRNCKSINKNHFDDKNTESNYYEKLLNIEDRFNTKNLNEFLKVYKSEKQKKKKEFKYDYDKLIGSIGQSSQNNEFKLDTVKNTIGAPDPKSSFFRVKDAHFVRKNSNKFFMDERLRKRNEKILRQNKLIKIIKRENRFLEQKENYFIKNQQFETNKRNNNKTYGNFIVFLIIRF